MQEIKSLKNEVDELKKSMKFTQNDLEKRVTNVVVNICKVKEDLKVIYEYQIDPDYLNNSLTDIRNKLTELEEGRERIIFFQRLLSEELDINDVVIEPAHRVTTYGPRKKNSKKLRARTIVSKLLSFFDKARIIKNSHRLKGTLYYVNEDFIKKH